MPLVHVYGSKLVVGGEEVQVTPPLKPELKKNEFKGNILNIINVKIFEANSGDPSKLSLNLKNDDTVNEKNKKLLKTSEYKKNMLT